MSVKDIMKLNAVSLIDISNIDEDNYFGEGWALLHLDSEDNIKGLHYKATDDDEFNYKDYIAENDIKTDDVIYRGFIDEYIFFVTEFVYQNGNSTE